MLGLRDVFPSTNHMMPIPKLAQANVLAGGAKRYYGLE